MAHPDVTDLQLSQYTALAELWKANHWPIGATLLDKLAPLDSSAPKHNPYRHFFAIPDPDDSTNLVAGGATLLQGSIAAIILIMVRDDHQRKGLGSTIFKRCLKAALDGAETKIVWITATPAGAPIYRRIGFEEMGKCTLLVFTEASRKKSFLIPDGHHFAHVRAKDMPAEAVKMSDDALGGGSRMSLIHDATTYSVLLYAGDHLVGWAGVTLEDEVPSNVGPVIMEKENTPVAACLALLDEVVAKYASQSPQGLLITIDDRFGSSETTEQLLSSSGGWKKLDSDIITMINFEKGGSREWYDQHFGSQRRKDRPVQLAYFAPWFS